MVFPNVAIQWTCMSIFFCYFESFQICSDHKWTALRPWVHTQHEHMCPHNDHLWSILTSPLYMQINMYITRTNRNNVSIQKQNLTYIITYFWCIFYKAKIRTWSEKDWTETDNMFTNMYTLAAKTVQTCNLHYMFTDQMIQDRW